MKKLSVWTKTALALAVLVPIALAGLWLAWMKYAPRRVPAGQPALATLDAASLGRLRDAFNEHHDEVRILVMLSPT